MYGLVTTLHYKKLGFVYNSVVDIIQNEGPYEAFYAMISGKAIATGMQSWMTFWDMVTVDEPKDIPGTYHAPGGQEDSGHYSPWAKSYSHYLQQILMLTYIFAELTPGDWRRHVLALHTSGSFPSPGNDIDYVDLLEMVINLDPDIAEKSQIRRDMSALLGPLPPLKFV